MQQQDTQAAFFKVLISWAGALVGSITLQDIVWTLTAVYTALQIWILMRDKFPNRRKGR